MAGKRGLAVRKTPECPPEWKEFMAEARRIRVANKVTTTEVAAAIGVKLNAISAWEICTQAPHPWDLAIYLRVIGATQLLENARL